jgi:hypothetical protein
MAAPRSVYPWDIVINRIGDKLFFDKRDASQIGELAFYFILFYFILFFVQEKTNNVCLIDLFTVNETSPDPPSDAEGINSPDSLALEATYVNQSFIQQVLGKVNNILSLSLFLSFSLSLFLFEISQVLPFILSPLFRQRRNTTSLNPAPSLLRKLPHTRPIATENSSSMRRIPWFSGLSLMPSPRSETPTSTSP